MPKIMVENFSGVQQTYAVFAQKPQITGYVNGQIWQNIIDSARAPSNQLAHFEVSQEYYAFCGTSQGTPADGVLVDVSNVRPVTLGTQSPGTTLPFTVEDEAPQFRDVLPSSAYANAYEIKTDDSFSMSDAKRYNLLIGLGASSRGVGTAPVASFIPQPNVDYQIQPSNVYWVTFGDYDAGSLVDDRRVSNSVRVDFAQLGDVVTIVHDDRGQLNVQN